MSGTSLDGLDIAFCRFTVDKNRWSYEILNAETKPYTEEWKSLFLTLENTDAHTFQQAHVDFGLYCGRVVSDFMIKYGIIADFVSSHGHTIFHQPERKLTVQIGSGSAIASACKMPVVCDFRSLDVALGGQGAPLVPVGDKLLFPDFDYCLNLGGFANISYEYENKRIAFDICPVNIVMNSICEKQGKPFDDKGQIAASGMVSPFLLNEFNQLPFYKLPPHAPKSLGKEWVIDNIDPILNEFEIEENDLLRTFCEHAAIQIARTVSSKKEGKLLITGGGTYNDFLIERLKELIPLQIIIPDRKTIEFKEALIFAFLGVLRIRNEVNSLKSVTGARQDSCGGAVYYC